MRVLVAGAPGVLGASIVQQPLAAGHTILGIARSTGGAERLRQLNARPLIADSLSRGRLLQTVQGIEAAPVCSANGR
jgi:nucleoside-diphosphate-sugar epimerase